MTSGTVPTASILIPTQDRADYLRVTLASVVPQARRAGAEVLVIGHAHDAATAAVAREFAVRLVCAPNGGSLNAPTTQDWGRADAKSL